MEDIQQDKIIRSISKILKLKKNEQIREINIKIEEKKIKIYQVILHYIEEGEK